MTAYPPPPAAFRPAPLAHNLFFAAQPPTDVAHQIGRAWRALGTVDPYRGEVLYMTVLRLGQMVTAVPPDPARIEQAMREFRFPAFELTLNRMATFGRGPDKNPPSCWSPPGATRRWTNWRAGSSTRSGRGGMRRMAE